MKQSPSKGGRPRHVAVYATGQLAQKNFLAGMGVVLRPAPVVKPAPKRTRSNSDA